MFRYDENNQPIQPSFLVTDNLNVLRNTETAPEETTYWTGAESYQKRTNNFYMNRVKQHAAEHGIPIILLDRSTYGDKSERAKQTADEYIAKNCASVLAAGMSPDYVKSKLSAEDIWQNYDTLATYMPDMKVETEFNNLVNDRLASALKKSENAPTNEAQQQAYCNVIYDIVYGSDAHDYLERGGDSEQLLKLSHQTGDPEIVKTTQQLLEEYK